MTGIVAALIALGTILTAQTAVWVISVRRRNASVADVGWGIGFGLLAGVCCTFAWEYLLGDTAQRYRPTDPTTLVTVALVVIGVAMAACMLPARRAAGMEPVRALRQE